MTFATLGAGRVCIESGDIAPVLDACTPQEESAVEWVRETFVQAEIQGSAAIMFIFFDGVLESHTELWLSLREEIAGFGKPVVGIHRNSRHNRADKPFQTVRGPSANLTSIVTGGGDARGDANGAENVPWLKINVDTRSTEVFSFLPQTPEQASK